MLKNKVGITSAVLWVLWAQKTLALGDKEGGQGEEWKAKYTRELRVLHVKAHRVTCRKQERKLLSRLNRVNSACAQVDLILNAGEWVPWSSTPENEARFGENDFARMFRALQRGRDAMPM